CRDNVDRQVRSGMLSQLCAHHMGLTDEHYAYAQFAGSQYTAFNLGAGRVVSAHGVNSDCDHRIYPTALPGRQFLDGTQQKKAASGRLILHGAAFIEAAVGTRLMRLLGFVAIRAFAKGRLLEKIMGSPGARPSLRMPSFWVRHSNTPRSRLRGRILWAFGPVNYCFFSQSCFRRARGASRGSVAWVSQRHSSWFKLAPQFGHNPRQSLWQMTLRGSANSTCSLSTSARKRPSPSKKPISVSSSLSRSSFGLAPLGKGASNRSKERLTSSMTGSRQRAQTISILVSSWPSMRIWPSSNSAVAVTSSGAACLTSDVWKSMLPGAKLFRMRSLRTARSFTSRNTS